MDVSKEENAAELIAQLLQEYGWGIDRVKRHYDYAPNKKYCPHRTMDKGWDRFLNMVRSKLGKEQEIAQIKKELLELEKGIDPKLMAKYKQLRQDRIFPVFAPLSSRSCGICMLELSAVEVDKVKNL